VSRVFWTDPALAALNSIHAYISLDSEAYADAVVQSIFHAVRRLEQFPLSGRHVPEVPDRQERSSPRRIG